MRAKRIGSPRPQVTRSKWRRAYNGALDIPCHYCGKQTRAVTSRPKSRPGQSKRQCRGGHLAWYMRETGAFVGPNGDGDNPKLPGKTCYFPGCRRPRHAKKTGHMRLCAGHLKQQQRGTPLRPLKFRRKGVRPSRKPSGKPAFARERDILRIVEAFLSGDTAVEIGTREGVDSSVVREYLRRYVPGEGNLRTRRKVWWERGS